MYNGYSSHFRPITEYQAVTQKIHRNGTLFFLSRQYRPQKKHTARILQAYRHYLNTSSQPLPLLIADLKEEVINNYLRTYGLTDIKSMLYYRVISLTRICLPCIAGLLHSFILRYAKVSVSLSWKLWHVVHLLSPHKPLLCPKLPERMLSW